jgi:hypothetical protein
VQDLVWVNEERESGNPFDLKFKTALDGTDGLLCQKYVEVKTTTSNDKNAFEISLNELQFANTHRGNFMIFRVFNAATPSQLRVVRIDDPTEMLIQKGIKLLMVM